jgi:hypothetical protein
MSEFPMPTRGRGSARRHRRKDSRELPSPGQLRTEISVLLEELARLQAAYRWAHESSYGPSVSEERNSVSENDPNDPTGNVAIATQRERIRFACRRALSDVKAAVAEVREANYTLGVAMAAADHTPSADVPAGTKRTVGPRELGALRAAKQRRESRGQGWGDG